MDCQSGGGWPVIHFTPPDEPVNFDRDVRQPGIAWLERNSVGRPKAYWNLSQYKSALADGFGNLCAYSAMYEPVGTVDQTGYLKQHDKAHHGIVRPHEKDFRF